MSFITIDDRSSSVSYGGAWGRGGLPSDYNDSVTYATGAGQTATLAFQGIGIGVYGDIRIISPGIPAPVTTYSIDGGAPTAVNQVQDSVEHWNVSYYQSPTLPFGQHTLVVTNLFDNHAAFFIDYFLIQLSGSTASSPPPAVTTAVTSTSGPSSSSSSPSPASASSSLSSRPSSISSSIISNNISEVISTSTLTNGKITVNTVFIPLSPTGQSASASNATLVFSSDAASSDLKKPPLGIILGASIGGAVVVILTILLVFFWYRWRRRKDVDWQNVSQFSDRPNHWQSGALFSSPLQKFGTHTQDTRSPSSLEQSPSVERPVLGRRPPSYSLHPPAYDDSTVSPTSGPSKFRT